MPRPPRIDAANAIHHIYARGNDRGAIFLDDADRYLYLDLLGKVVTDRNWNCLSYVLMTNHVHLLIQTPIGDLSNGIHWVHGRYAKKFNRRHMRSGHLFQSRFGSALIESDDQLLATRDYISNNPVKAGMCADASDWPWSSSTSQMMRRPDWMRDAWANSTVAGLAAAA